MAGEDRVQRRQNAALPIDQRPVAVEGQDLETAGVEIGHRSGTGPSAALPVGRAEDDQVPSS